MDATGVTLDPEKVTAVHAMKEPADVSELRRFLGMANKLAKFTPSMAETTKPLCDLLSRRMHGSGETVSNRPSTK